MGEYFWEGDDRGGRREWDLMRGSGRCILPLSSLAASRAAASHTRAPSHRPHDSVHESWILPCRTAGGTGDACKRWRNQRLASGEVLT